MIAGLTTGLNIDEERRLAKEARQMQKHRATCEKKRKHRKNKKKAKYCK